MHICTCICTLYRAAVWSCEKYTVALEFKNAHLNLYIFLQGRWLVKLDAYISAPPGYKTKFNDENCELVGMNQVHPSDDGIDPKI